MPCTFEKRHNKFPFTMGMKPRGDLQKTHPFKKPAQTPLILRPPNQPIRSISQNFRYQKPGGIRMHLYKLYGYIPIGSMYGIFTHIWLICMVNVGKYTSPMDPTKGCKGGNLFPHPKTAVFEGSFQPTQLPFPLTNYQTSRFFRWSFAKSTRPKVPSPKKSITSEGGQQKPLQWCHLSDPE